MNEFLAGIVKHMKRDATMDYLLLTPIPSEHNFTKRSRGVPKYTTYNGTCGNSRASGTQLIKRTNRIPFPRRDRGTVIREFCIIKPLEKLAKLGDNRSELVGRSCIEELVKYSKHKYLTNYRPAQIL